MKKMSNNKNESVYSFVVLGEPASKSNSRRLVTIKGRPAFIKSKKAIDYVKNFQKQCPAVNPLMEGYLEVEMTVYYATRRPDLDESVILDCMQDKIYKNDRQVKSKIVRWGLSKSNPRAEIEVRPIKKPPHEEGA
jgi:Holliday junction resolvase RusA-like endonuclease|tara:strand:- start:1055 stop:1459 length:405 start_codon:yes stop_codon:yes gene_type:complete